MPIYGIWQLQALPRASQLSELQRHEAGVFERTPCTPSRANRTRLCHTPATATTERNLEAAHGRCPAPEQECKDLLALEASHADSAVAG